VTEFLNQKTAMIFPQIGRQLDVDKML